MIVDNGVLRINSGNFVLRIGDWSEINLNVRIRFQMPNEVVINYYMQEEGHYAFILLGDHAVLEKISGPGPSPLADGDVTGFKDNDWNDVNIKVEGGDHTITINQSTVFTVTDPEPLTTGAVMLHVLGGSSMEVDSISLTGTPGGEPPPEGQGAEEGPPPEEIPADEGAAPAGEEPAGQPAATGVPGTGTAPADTRTLIEELLAGQSNQLELTTFLINLLLAVIASFILGRVYIFWGSSLSNRRAFASNFMLLTVTTTFIILVVRSSVALSLGLVGALSIVRFRAAVKEPEELAFLFFAISLGIGLGDNQRLITLLTLVVGIVVMGLLRLFRNTKSDINLHLTVASKNPGKVELDQITAVLDKHCSKIKLLRFDETAEVLETSYVIEFKRVSDLSKAKAELQTLSPSLDISFLDNRGIW
ncbi:MAG: DUF4956 domain-containing protein [Anaerolineales bacterium]